MKYKRIKEDILLKQIHEVHLPEFMKNTVQIFAINSIDGIFSLGTGVLCEFDRRNFILTANHNLEGENIDELRLRIDSKLIHLPSIQVIYTKPKVNELIDKYDIAIIEILDSDAIIDFKARMQFIGLENIGLNASQRMSEKVNISRNDYMCFGFPGRATKVYVDKKKEFRVSPYLLGCGLNKRNLDSIINEGYNCHLFINKMKKSTNYNTNIRTNIRNLNGMSGCGLWDINYFDAQTGRFVMKLVGILIRQNIDLLIFTKVDLIIGMMRDIVGIKSLPETLDISKVCDY